MMSETVSGVWTDAMDLVAQAYEVTESTRVAPQAVRRALTLVTGSLESAAIGLQKAYAKCESCLKHGDFEDLARAAAQAQASIRAVDETSKTVKPWGCVLPAGCGERGRAVHRGARQPHQGRRVHAQRHHPGLTNSRSGHKGETT